MANRAEVFKYNFLAISCFVDTEVCIWSLFVDAERSIEGYLNNG